MARSFGRTGSRVCSQATESARSSPEGHKSEGAGFRKQVQFTSLNAAHNANEAMEGELMPLLRVLRPYKPRGRG